MKHSSIHILLYIMVAIAIAISIIGAKLYFSSSAKPKTAAIMEDDISSSLGTSEKKSFINTLKNAVLPKKKDPPVPKKTPGKELLTANTNEAHTEADFLFITDTTVRKQQVAQVNIKEYRTVIDETDINTQRISEFQKTESGFNTSTKTIQKGKEVSAMIKIGDTVYVKDEGDGKWWKQKMKINAADNDINSFSNLSLSNPQITYEANGEKTCGTNVCLVYKEKNTKSNTNTRTFLFDKKTLLLYQEEDGVAPFKSIITYEYPIITITAPTNTKDVPDNNHIFDYYETVSRYSFSEKLK